MRNWRASSHSTQRGTNYAQWRKSCRNSTKCQEAPSTQFFWPNAHRLRAATPTKWFRTISWQCFMRHMHIEAHISDQTYQKREIFYHGRFDITTHELYIFVYNYLACTAYIQFRVSLAVERSQTACAMLLMSSAVYLEPKHKHTLNSVDFHFIRAFGSANLKKPTTSIQFRKDEAKHLDGLIK